VLWSLATVTCSFATHWGWRAAFGVVALFLGQAALMYIAAAPLVAAVSCVVASFMYEKEVAQYNNVRIDAEASTAFAH
jgi:hypothetical protein